MNPKVFVSHASEDKERFVTEFATKLRAKGVDAWLDKWEMLPGDSLIDKIFEEGLKTADAVIIILSNNSVNKPWVKEELNASFVSKISNGTKIIPIVLDDCKVPESLKSTLWEKIDTVDNYNPSFERVLSSIFGVTDKPELGSMPSHAAATYQEIGGITKADNLILKASCEKAIKTSSGMISPDSLFGDGNNFGFGLAEIKDCIEILEQNNCLKVKRTLGGGANSLNCHYTVTTYGFDKYANAYISDYQEIIMNVVTSIVNGSARDSHSIAESIGKPVHVINHVLEVLKNNGHLRIRKVLSTVGGTSIDHVAASLRRFLNS